MDLVPSFVADQSVRDSIVGVAFDVQQRLITCADIAESLEADVRIELERAASLGLSTQSGGRLVELPAVSNLSSRAEKFLYHAKLCLRDIARLFKPFFGQHFDENFYAFTEWAKEKFGPDDQLARMLRDDRAWIVRVIDMRNGVEHPKHRAGPFHVENFRLDPVARSLVAPTWWQGDNPSSRVDEDMRTIVGNLLTLYEEPVVLFLLKIEHPSFVDIAEILEGDRRPETPMRFRVILTGFPPTDGSPTAAT